MYPNKPAAYTLNSVSFDIRKADLLLKLMALVALCHGEEQFNVEIIDGIGNDTRQIQEVIRTLGSLLGRDIPVDVGSYEHKEFSPEIIQRVITHPQRSQIRAIVLRALEINLLTRNSSAYGELVILGDGITESLESTEELAGLIARCGGIQKLSLFSLTPEHLRPKIEAIELGTASDRLIERDYLGISLYTSKVKNFIVTGGLYTSLLPIIHGSELTLLPLGVSTTDPRLEPFMSHFTLV